VIKPLDAHTARKFSGLYNLCLFLTFMPFISAPFSS